jgi:excisionase family DNA binding protein
MSRGWLTPSEAAVRLRISEVQVRKYIRSGRLRAEVREGNSPSGNRYRVRARDVRAFDRARRFRPARRPTSGTTPAQGSEAAASCPQV